MTKKLLLYLFFSLSFPILNYSQNCAGSCTWTITSSDTSSYTINIGQTLCVQSAGVAKGHIVLSGGTICVNNGGVLNTSNLSLNQGVVNNFGTIMHDGNFSLASGSITLNNNDGGTLNILGDLTISNVGVSFTNQGTVNITGNIIMSAGSIVNNDTMNYANITKTGGTNTNNATVNCCGGNSY